ncbi:polysaccharide biosynthesis protein [Siphonobacter sp. BAB-5405]|uniref:lipopolysaccharide biosynthesis protein n=1 Tax=Siphonobacter sp. BAB-5405 TaxID=1864825 RepID=UPI000C80224E|nr:polysaccharide biosynthesis protein [Siphonobacter sp. BAB-5405]PMD90715.1 polysaccharide biosynthesis protein [Siphonobacter sp. BAB-5405]
MNVTVEKLRANLPHSKVQEWIKLISITGLSQAVIQGMGLVCGLFIIRILTPQEYAFYTLANTMLGTMMILADCGIGNSVMAQGGKVWQDRQKLGVVLATGLELRKKLAVVSFLVVAPLLAMLLLQHGASPLNTGLILMALIPAFMAGLSDTILEVVPKLTQQIVPLQRNQTLVSINRLVLAVVALILCPWTYVAMLANGLPRVYGNQKLRKIAYAMADENQKPDPIVRQQMFKTIKRVLPENIYFCLSGQLTIWLTSIFGTTMALASLGAIGRIGMVISLFSTLFSTLFTPRFARLPAQKPQLFTYAISTLIGTNVLVLGMMLMIWFFSTELLWILGEQYQGLEEEMILSVFNSCLSFVLGCFFSLNVSRGWIINPIGYILISVSTTVLSMWIFDVSTLTGVLQFNTVVLSVQTASLLAYCLYRIHKI